ncbi:MAG TPA: lysozyme, partial [Candidatus Cloacimonadota bacterium]|nr:lysozyme [Candidatus Cloacimonadota bacterium]
MLKKHEGLVLKPYKCSAGKLTIGYGRNLEARS